MERLVNEMEEKKILINIDDEKVWDLEQELLARGLEVEVHTCVPVNDDPDEEEYTRIVIIPKNDDELETLSKEFSNRGFEVEIATYTFVGEF